MRNKDVIEAFLRHEKGSTKNLRSTGIRLLSYNTCIAEHYGDEIIGNATKYSTTSSAHLFHVRPYVNKWTTRNVPINTWTLYNYL